MKGETRGASVVKSPMRLVTDCQATEPVIFTTVEMQDQGPGTDGSLEGHAHSFDTQGRG